MKRSVLFVILLCAALAWGDDGEMLRRDLSRTPADHTEHAAMTMLELYVPAQSSSGELVSIEYINADDSLVETREDAKPLIAFFQDGHVDEVADTPFGHGHRDAYAAVSLDDGESWKRTNLSKSGDLSSFKIKAAGRKKVPYPGDVVRLFASSAGNKAMLVWASRYCAGGKPTYAMDEAEIDALAERIGKDAGECDTTETEGFEETLCPYFEDYWGVAGTQGSSDFADEGYPTIGEVPYSCMWAARGTLEQDPDTNLYNMVWRKAERLTSGRRDAHRMEVHCEAGAGCVVTWQEDPEGLRPGEGEGPGEGFSGAVAHHETDTWYSYISWANFGLVDADGIYGDPIELGLYEGDGSPPVGVPMSIPARLTDNAMCNGASSSEDPTPDDYYCYMDFDDNGTADFCAETFPVNIITPEGPVNDVILCQTEDGRLLRGNTASTRPRTNLRGYDSDGDGIYDSAWVIMAYEESKGLGEEVDLDPNELIEKVDMGKNIWYHSFDMSLPDFVAQGGMLNQPAVYPDDWVIVGGRLFEDASLGYRFMMINPDPVYEEQAGVETTLYQTEIARRFSLISQDFADAEDEGSGTVAFTTWKQGIIRRGGPADVMARRFVIPDVFDPAIDNPYDYANMQCAAWAFTDGSNPRYVKGFCASPAINMSGSTILTGDSCTDATMCLDEFPFNEYFDDLAGGEPIAKILTWQQFGPGFGEIPPDESNLDDNSWDNPYEVAKGHRGYMDGDFIMLLYAWSPNWLANTVGHDNYNLYVRRSFDGGVSWSTTPVSFTHTDGVTYSGNGTTTCEWMGPAGGVTEYPVCTTYSAGDFEQARNVSQLVGNGETILDPRYSPTRPDITDPYFDDDVRDPSRFFMVYETGDNNTVAEGEAEPLDLYYSRGVEWGDHFLVWQDEADAAACLPSVDDADLTGFCNEFDPLEGSQNALSGEASVTANPGGTQFYAVWNQEDVDGDGEVITSDAWFRRVAFYDDYVPTGDDPGGPGNTDADGDLYYAEVDDCDDLNSSIHPGATEICGDGIDQDCDGADLSCGGICLPSGDACTMITADECCSGRCHPVKLTCK